MFLVPALTHRNGSARGSLAAVGAALFLAGIAIGTLLGSWARAPEAAPQNQIAQRDQAMPGPRPAASRAITPGGHPAEVLRVIDGDTFEAQVRIWPGIVMTTKVRLRGIDAAELHARCAVEYDKAVAARDALTRLLAEGGVVISQVSQDKYGGRVDADVATQTTPDVSSSLLQAGLVRPYSGGRRRSWCDG